ncbi:MAG: PD-(D/E)XK nuclease family protein [Anaerolineae bacterium]|nr:PD-(D/E)XK nuclease family protein [Anaerolineae bacterium]
MPTEIWLAPVGAGKTEYVLEQLVHTIEAQPFARVWVLVSGKRQEDAFRQRLVERAGGRRVVFNVEFFSFYQLYHRLLNIARRPPRMLDDAARYGLLRGILTNLKNAGQLDAYETIAETPGFVRIMAAFLYELKQNLVPPDTYTKAALVSESAKDAEIARIYAQYQATLQAHDLVDREGEGWLALEYARTESYAPMGRQVDLLLVDGYDQFTPLQASLLMQVAEHARRALVMLATVPGREETVGRRFVEAFGQLQKYSPTPPVIHELPRRMESRRAPVVQQVVDSLFLRSAVPQSADGRVMLLEAPDPVQEAAEVLRRVKRLLLAGAQPDDVLIALRDWPRYGGHFAALGRAYGVPLALHQGDPLGQNPAVMSLLNLLGLYESDFRRRDLLDALRSPYFDIPGLGSKQIEQLDQISQRLIVAGGRANWLDAITSAGQPLTVGEDRDVSADASLLDGDSAAHLHTHLSAFFEQVTPAPGAALADYVRWLRDLIGRDDEVDPDDERDDWLPSYSLRMPAQIRRGDAPDLISRDLTALDEFMRVLRSLLAAETLLAALHADRVLDRTLFLLELRTAVNHTAIQRGPVRTGRVLVTTVTDARGLPHPHVFIPGLSEGVFPAPLPEDPLYLDSERQALIERGIVLETQAERAADDGLFYQLVGLARETLTLSRPTVQEGAPWLPSHLWRAVTATIRDADALIQQQRIGVGQVVPITEAAAPDEVLLAAADGLSRESALADLPGAYTWALREFDSAWRRIDHARAMERRRLSRWMAHDRYSGRLKDPVLIAYAAAQLGSDRVWSATQLNDYGVCGFRFFARRLLRLEALEEPEEGLDAAKLGTINHAILEATYRQLTQRGLAIAPENLDEALNILRRAAEPLLANAPREHGFADNALWAEEQAVLLRRLEALVRLDFSDQSPITRRLAPGPRWPAMQEQPFTTDGGVSVSIPVEIDGQTERLRVQGFIDRIDRVGEGVVIVDYKSGSSPIPVGDMREGRNFQMMLYLHAAQQILEAQYGNDAPIVLGGLFWHIRSQKSSGELRLDDEGWDALEQARGHIGRYIAAGRFYGAAAQTDRRALRPLL